MAQTQPLLTPLAFERVSLAEQLARSRQFLALMRTRRTVREFSTEPVAYELIENAVAAAATAPSGANQQPWKFAVVSNPRLKHQIREAAEREEKESYERRMSDEWLDALAPLGTDWHKPHLENAPYLIIVFMETYGTDAQSSRHVKHYYAIESVCIAIGVLLCSLHHAGLVTLTHTPSPMRFLGELLGRPANERAVVVIPVGYPAADAQVPVIPKKSLDEVLIRYD